MSRTHIRRGRAGFFVRDSGHSSRSWGFDGSAQVKIGILTFHRAYNCGAMLQAWAMKRTLEKMGHAAEFPVCNHAGETPRWLARSNPNRHGPLRLASMGVALGKNALSVPVEDVARARYRRFRRRHLPERECAAGELGKFFDALVVGSDQVWNGLYAEPWLPLFLGENWSPGIRAVAYGAGYGDTLPEGESLGRMKAAIGRFAGVSVRESYVRDDLERAGVTHGQVAVVSDPTLLLDRGDYGDLEKEATPPRGPYLFMYSVRPDSRGAARVAQGLARRMGLQAVVAPVYQYTRWGAPRGLTYGMSPERLVAYTAAAACVVACSFHGTALGVLFGKPTLSLLSQPDEGRSRCGELLRGLGEAERLVSFETPLDEMQRVLERGPMSPSASERLEAGRAASLAWLEARLGDLGGGGR